MRPHSLRFFPLALCAFVLGLVAPSFTFGAANIVIINGDGAGEGFNDTTAAAPVGGNLGTTVGAQRLNAFQQAANIWGATLTSTQTISVRARFDPLTCTANSAVLGSAGAAIIERDFTGAPFSGTWYGEALAEKLFGGTLSATHEINATFNSNLGQANCLTGTFFYLGLDNNHGSSIDLVTVLLHEFAHGLGFQTFTSGSTGAQNSGYPTIYDRFLIDLTNGKSWLQMVDAERVASAINNHNLAWDGPQVLAEAPSVLVSGMDPFGKPLLYTPNPFAGGSSVSHWDTIASPNQLMEPALNGNLSHNVTPPSDLTYSELKEVGWVTNPLPNAIAVAGGNGQSVNINTQLPAALSVKVTPAVAGLEVTFTANNSPEGANGTFANTGTRTTTAATNASGVATAPAFTTNGQAGTFKINATVAGAGTVTFSATSFGPLVLSSAASRKTHGAIATPFDVLLPQSNPFGVESRQGSGTGNGNHTLVVTFSNPVVSGSAAVTAGTGSVVGSPSFSARTMIVNLTGVANTQLLTVALSGVTDSSSQVLPNTGVSMIVLLADTTGDKFVNSGDAQITRSLSGQNASATSFRADVNADGTVNSGDAFIVRARSGDFVP